MWDRPRVLMLAAACGQPVAGLDVGGRLRREPDCRAAGMQSKVLDEKSKPRCVGICARQGRQVATAAHVPQAGLRPSFLLYFAAAATRHPWRDTGGIAGPDNQGGSGAGGRGALRSEVKKEASAAGRQRVT